MNTFSWNKNFKYQKLGHLYLIVVQKLVKNIIASFWLKFSHMLFSQNIRKLFNCLITVYPKARTTAVTYDLVQTISDSKR